MHSTDVKYPTLPAWSKIATNSVCSCRKKNPKRKCKNNKQILNKRKVTHSRLSNEEIVLFAFKYFSLLDVCKRRKINKIIAVFTEVFFFSFIFQIISQS
jgi:hypothetical protein